jgi:hypothetical protein
MMVVGQPAGSSREFAPVGKQCRHASMMQRAGMALYQDDYPGLQNCTSDANSLEDPAGWPTTIIRHVRISSTRASGGFASHMFGM